MTKYARMDGGVVAEIINLPSGVVPASAFQADLASTLVSCSDSVAVGWAYASNTFAAPTVAPMTEDELVAYAAAKRYAVETGGIVVNGAGIPTDRQSQNMIIGAYSYVDANPTVLVQFKTDAGFVQMNATQVTAIANAVGAHVQASFADEAAVVAAIVAGTIKTAADIDGHSWQS